MIVRTRNPIREDASLGGDITTLAMANMQQLASMMHERRILLC